MRYRAPKELDASTTNFRELVPSKLAAAIWNSISTYKSTIPNYPQKESCELLIVDRSIDQVMIGSLMIILSQMNVNTVLFMFYIDQASHLDCSSYS